jgi:hypothetical protein
MERGANQLSRWGGRGYCLDNCDDIVSGVSCGRMGMRRRGFVVESYRRNWGVPRTEEARMGTREGLLEGFPEG